MTLIIKDYGKGQRKHLHICIARMGHQCIEKYTWRGQVALVGVVGWVTNCGDCMYLNLERKILPYLLRIVMYQPTRLCI